MDLFVVPTIGFDLLYALVIVRLDRRDLVWINVTPGPTAEWIAHQITEAFPWNEAPRYLIRDRDRVYGTAVTRRLRAMGIRDKPTAADSPWQNAYAVRLIGTIRRERLDHMIAFGRRTCGGSLASMPPTIMNADSSIAGQGCTVSSGDRAPRRHHIATCSTRPASPILPILSFQHTQG
jgi:hypothetical protein